MSSDAPTDEDLGPVLRGEALPNGEPLPKRGCKSCGEPTIWADLICTRCGFVGRDPRPPTSVRQYRRIPTPPPVFDAVQLSTGNVDQVAAWISSLIRPTGGAVTAICGGDHPRIEWRNTYDADDWDLRLGDYVLREGMRCVSFTATRFGVEFEVEPA